MMLINTLSVSTATFVGQNYGAGNIERMREGIRKTYLMSFVCCGIIWVILQLYAGVFIEVLTGTQDTFIIQTAAFYLRVNVPFFFSLVVLQNIRTSLQGMGDKVTPVFSSIIELLLKVGASFALIPTMGYMGVCIIEPIIWMMCMFWLIFSYMKFMKKHNYLKKREDVNATV